MIELHQAQNRHIDMKINHYCEIRREKARKNLLRPDRDSNPRPCAPRFLWQATLLASVFRHLQRPGEVVEQQDVCTGTQRLPFWDLGLTRPNPVLHIHINNAIPLLGLQLVASEPGDWARPLVGWLWVQFHRRQMALLVSDETSHVLSLNKYISLASKRDIFHPVSVSRATLRMMAGSFTRAQP